MVLLGRPNSSDEPALIQTKPSRILIPGRRRSRRALLQFVPVAAASWPSIKLVQEHNLTVRQLQPSFDQPAVSQVTAPRRPERCGRNTGLSPRRRAPSWDDLRLTRSHAAYRALRSTLMVGRTRLRRYRRSASQQSALHRSGREARSEVQLLNPKPTKSF